MSWSWKESELSWSPTTYDVTDDESVKPAGEFEENNLDRNSNFAFRCCKTSRRKPRKKVRAKIWRPRFPGEKTSEKIDVQKPETDQTLPVGSALSSTVARGDFLESNYRDDGASGLTHLSANVSLNEQLTANQVDSDDFHYESPFHDYALPPVSSLFQYPCEHSSSGSEIIPGEDNYMPEESNYAPDMNGFLQENDSFSMDTNSIDEFFWNTKKIITKPTSLAFHSNMSLPVK